MIAIYNHRESGEFALYKRPKQKSWSILKRVEGVRWMPMGYIKDDYLSEFCRIFSIEEPEANA